MERDPSSQEESAGRNISMGQLVTKVLVSHEPLPLPSSPFIFIFLWIGIHTVVHRETKGMEGGVSSLGDECQNYGDGDEI